MTSAVVEVPYPSHLECDVVLRTGRTIRLRPVRHEDREGLLDFFRRLSPTSLYSRFFNLRTPEAALACGRPTIAAPSAWLESERGIVAVAHYFALPSDRRSESRSRSATTCGVRRRDAAARKIVDVARTQSIDRFEAETLSESSDAVRVPRLRIRCRQHSAAGVVSYHSRSPDCEIRRRSAERSQKAASACGGVRAEIDRRRRREPPAVI
jgi:hypothetical protein